MTDMASLATDAARHGHEAPAAACPNCDTPFGAAPPRYCPHCGQQTTLHPPSIGEFAHEFVGHYVAFEGPLWKTLGLLLLRPGRLTREYLDGRRRRYVLPLRLYLSASFLFFLAFKLLASYEGPTFNATTSRGAARAASAPAASAASESGERFVLISPAGVQVASGPQAAVIAKKALDSSCGPAATRHCNWFERKAEEASHRWVENPKTRKAAFTEHLLGSAPYAIFLMLPAFAAVVGLAYWNRRMLFGEHFVFGMHMHSFWFLAGLAALLLPAGAGSWLFLVTLLYGVLALRTVYGGGWVATLVRSSVILGVYGTLLGLASTFLAMVLFLS